MIVVKGKPINNNNSKKKSHVSCVSQVVMKEWGRSSGIERTKYDSPYWFFKSEKIKRQTSLV